MNSSYGLLEFEEGEYPFGDFNVTEIEEEAASGHRLFFSIWRILTDLIKLGVCIGSLGASIFLIYVFIKFKRLQKGSHIYFLHYAIANCIEMFFIPMFALLHELVLRKFMGWQSLCVVFQLNQTAVFYYICFISALCIDWYLVLINHKLVQNYEKFQRILIGVIYISGAVKFLAISVECFVESDVWTSNLILVAFVLAVVVLIGLNYLVYKRTLTAEEQKTKYLFNTGNYVLLVHLPRFIIWIFWAILVHYRISYGAAIVLDIIESIADIFIYSIMIVVVYLLGQHNKHFRMAYDSIFKRKTKSYQSDNLDDSENTPNQNQNTTTNPSQINVVEPTGFV